MNRLWRRPVKASHLAPSFALQLSPNLDAFEPGMSIWRCWRRQPLAGRGHQLQPRTRGHSEQKAVSLETSAEELQHARLTDIISSQISSSAEPGEHLSNVKHPFDPTRPYGPDSLRHVHRFPPTTGVDDFSHENMFFTTSLSSFCHNSGDVGVIITKNGN